MIIKKIYNTDNKEQLLIDIPKKLQGKKRILVMLDDSIDTKDKKMELMKKASGDPLFEADINQVTNDFKSIDSEF